MEEKLNKEAKKGSLKLGRVRQGFLSDAQVARMASTHHRGREGFSWTQAVISEQLLTEEEGAVESIPGNEGRIDPTWANVRGWIAGFRRLILAF